MYGGFTLSSNVTTDFLNEPLVVGKGSNANTFRFRAFGKRFYPKRLTMSIFVKKSETPFHPFTQKSETI